MLAYRRPEAFAPAPAPPSGIATSSSSSSLTGTDFAAAAAVDSGGTHPPTADPQPYRSPNELTPAPAPPFGIVGSSSSCSSSSSSALSSAAPALTGPRFPDADADAFGVAADASPLPSSVCQTPAALDSAMADSSARPRRESRSTGPAGSLASQASRSTGKRKKIRLSEPKTKDRSSKKLKTAPRFRLAAKLFGSQNSDRQAMEEAQEAQEAEDEEEDEDEDEEEAEDEDEEEEEEEEDDQADAASVEDAEMDTPQGEGDNEDEDSDAESSDSEAEADVDAVSSDSETEIEDNAEGEDGEEVEDEAQAGCDRLFDSMAVDADMDVSDGQNGGDQLFALAGITAPGQELFRALPSAALAMKDDAGFKKRNGPLVDLFGRLACHFSGLAHLASVRLKSAKSRTGPAACCVCSLLLDPGLAGSPEQQDPMTCFECSGKYHLLCGASRVPGNCGLCATRLLGRRPPSKAAPVATGAVRAVTATLTASRRPAARARTAAPSSGVVSPASSPVSLSAAPRRAARAARAAAPSSAGVSPSPAAVNSAPLFPGSVRGPSGVHEAAAASDISPSGFGSGPAASSAGEMFAASKLVLPSFPPGFEAMQAVGGLVLYVSQPVYVRDMVKFTHGAPLVEFLLPGWVCGVSGMPGPNGILTADQIAVHEAGNFRYGHRECARF